MLFKHCLAHTGDLTAVVGALPASLWGDKHNDLSILSCKFLVHHIQFKMLIINLEILAPQRGHFAKDVFTQLLLDKPKNVMMLVWEGFYEPLPNHHVNVNRSHSPLFYVHTTQYMLYDLNAPSIS